MGAIKLNIWLPLSATVHKCNGKPWKIPPNDNFIRRLYYHFQFYDSIDWLIVSVQIMAIQKVRK